MKEYIIKKTTYVDKDTGLWTDQLAPESIFKPQCCPTKRNGCGPINDTYIKWQMQRMYN
jgi:hypothetical protein